MKEMKRILSLTLFIIILLCGCSVQSADDYYNSADNDGSLSATISINCQTAVDYPDCDVENAEVLNDFTVHFNDGDTVYDVLVKACKLNKIQFEYEGSGSSTYIKGINYLYEFDCGELSGWEYSVNGVFPSVGCGSYKLSDGDNIKWLYTCDLGADIGNKYKGGE